MAIRNFTENLLKSPNLPISPLIQREINRELIKLTNIPDLYKKEKEESNKIAMELVENLKTNLLKENRNFKTFLRFAIAGNIMDYGAFDNFDINNSIGKALNMKFSIDHSEQLYEKIQEAKTILYLGDNAGEIVFDKLFIENCMKNKVIYVVKASAIINDVTIKDAKYVGMHKIAKVISNGFDAPSTILSKSSSEFLEDYKSADLIISKGQGNLEGLLDEKDKRLFFLLMVKCDIIAQRLKVEKNSFVVLNNTYEY
ncbi:MAG: DUF89 family protein [Bacteroidales bacterium]|nr:ARMT1-like domain-containing protein [Bacteroidales bacterium]NLB87586.1 DUF89 family protein [Bacteroidales bacterium]